MQSKRKKEYNVQNCITTDTILKTNPPAGSFTPIGNNADHSEKTAEFIQATRNELFKLRRDIGEHIKRVRPCGAYVIDKHALVTLATAKNQKSVFYSGLQSCKSVWCCPVCSLKISYRRALEVNHMLTEAIINQGLHGQFVTLTIPHTVYENLKVLQLTVSEAFRELTNHPAYKGRNRKGVITTQGIKQKFDIKGFVRALEVKKKNKGWHPHLHIVFVMAATTAEKLEQFSTSLIKLWARIIKTRTGKVVNEEYGQDSKPITNLAGISDYISKWDIGKELTQANKKVRGESMTPFEIFQYYKQSGNEEYLNLFIHYVLSFHGVKQLTYSADFKKMFLIGIEEKTDEQACNEVEIEEILMAIDVNMFKALYAARVESDFLNLVQFNKDGAIDFLFNFFENLNHISDNNYPIFKI